MKYIGIGMSFIGLAGVGYTAPSAVMVCAVCIMLTFMLVD